jgi:hypothetical protein
MAEKKNGIVEADLTQACLLTAVIASALICTASLALAVPTITVTSSNLTVGDRVTLNGTGFGPNENITLTTTVTCWKPVVDGQCECDMEDFEILPGVRFDLTVREVKGHVLIYIKKGFFWLPIGPGSPGFTFAYNAATNTSNVSSVKIPTGGTYSIDVIGDAVDDAENCTMTTTATMVIQADGSGAFTQVFDTTGIPICCMRVTATGETSGPCTVDLQLCLKGDASKDGQVNAYDCCCIARYCCEIPGYDECTVCCTSADVDGNLGVTSNDARYLARYLVGLEDELH